MWASWPNSAIWSRSQWLFTIRFGIKPQLSTTRLRPTTSTSWKKFRSSSWMKYQGTASGMRRTIRSTVAAVDHSDATTTSLAGKFSTSDSSDGNT